MNEMKCPCCDSEAGDFDGIGIIECENCAFLCNTRDFPRLSAAMKLARLTVLNCTSFDPTLADEDALLAQIAKTVEAFK